MAFSGNPPEFDGALLCLAGKVGEVLSMLGLMGSCFMQAIYAQLSCCWYVQTQSRVRVLHSYMYTPSLLPQPLIFPFFQSKPTQLRRHGAVPSVCTPPNFVVEVVGGVDGFFSLADEFQDGAFVVFAAVDKPLHYAYDDDDEECDDAVVWRCV